MNSPGPVLTVHGVTKLFPGLRALDDVNLNLYPGEVHALMGENGAGKSTLIKVITGAYQRDEGQIKLQGKEIHPQSPLYAQALGISTVYQEVNLVPMLSVEENISLGREPKIGPSISWKQVRQRAQAALDRLGLQLDVTKPVASYSLAIQQMVAIARAVALDCQVLILDEPTSSLDDAETQRFFRVVNKLKSEGVAILFVTHFLDQVYEICDRITVLRNGTFVGEFPVLDLPKSALIRHMIGRELQDLTGNPVPAVEFADGATPQFAVEHLGRKGSVQQVDLTLHRGEVLGFAGLLGSGRTETMRLIYGADPSTFGKAVSNSQKPLPKAPAQAVKNHFAYCPEDRKAEGIFPELSVQENIIIARQVKNGWLKKISTKKQADIAKEAIKDFDIRTTDAEKPIGQLSGGNQQKAILARWLTVNTEVLLVDEPTRGIDVGTKAEIIKLVRKKSADGMSIIFVSSEWAEILQVAHKVLFFRDLRQIGELPNVNLTERQVADFIAEGAKDSEALAPQHLDAEPGGAN